MKKIFTATLLLAALTLGSHAQDKKANTLPSVTIKALDGSSLSTDAFDNGGKPIIISFWATWCKPCIVELNAIADVYADWQKETGVKLIALSIDDSRSMNSVAPFVNGKGWEYEIYLDPNGDFKRAMNINMVPHTFLLNGKKEIVDQHTSFVPGDEELLYEKVKKVAAGEPLN